MLYEQKRIRIHKVIWLILLILGFIIPFIITLNLTKATEVVAKNGYIIEYDESLNKTDCEIIVKFNRKVESGYIKVAFKDDNGNLLDEKENYFYCDNKTMSSSFSVDGKVDSYEILDIKTESNPSLLYWIIFIYLDIFIFIFFICSLFLSCKVYEYEGNEIIVYAGWYHHYIKINGVITDEHNTLVSYTAISLSSTMGDGTNIDVKISLTNRISLKINNRLYTKFK